MKFVALLLVVVGLAGCAAPPYYGTGAKFAKVINPEPDKYGLVYVYRKDGWGYGGNAKQHLTATVAFGDDTPKNYVAVYQANMYRPFLFEPRKVLFSSPASLNEQVEIKAGETYCVEIGWHFRGIDVVTTNSRPLDECMKDLADMELVRSLNDIRRTNGVQPLVLQGFKEVLKDDPPSAHQSMPR